MSVGLPVLTTANVAKSITAEESIDLLVASDEKSFIEKIKLLYSDQSKREEVGSRGRDKINSIYGEDVILNLLNERVEHLHNTIK